MYHTTLYPDVKVQSSVFDRGALPVRSIATLSLAVFLIGLPFAAYVGLAPGIEREWSLAPVASALLYSAYLLGAALGAGLVLPRISAGSPHVVRPATVLVASTHLAFGASPGPMVAAFLRVLAGLAYIAVYYGVVQWIAGVTPAAYRGRAIGATVAAGYGGTSASYLLVARVLAAGMDWRVGYFLVSLPGLLGVGAVWLAFRGAPVARPPRRASPASPVRWRQVGGARLALVIAGYAVHTAELFVARFWLPYGLIAAMAAGSGATAGAGAYLLAGLLFAAGVPSPFLGGWLSDRVGTGRTAGCILACGSVVAVLLVLSAGHPTVFVVLALAYCVLLPADSAVLTSGVTLYAHPRWLGRAQAVQAMAGSMAGAAAPALVGVLVQAGSGTEAWRVALATNAVVAMLGALLMVGIREDVAAHAPT